MKPFSAARGLQFASWFGRLSIFNAIRVLENRQPDSSSRMRSAPGIAMLLICATLAVFTTISPPPAIAAPPGTTETPLPEKRVNMLCVDADGKPVKGAEIYLFQFNHETERYQQFGPFNSDEQGAAVCEKTLFSNKLGNYDRWFYARVPDRLVGVARSVRWTGQKPFNVEGRIKLQPSTSIDGQVTVPPLIDCTKVTVRIRTMHVTVGSDFFDYESFPREASFRGLDTALPEIFECHPDAGGKIRFRDVPVQGKLYLVTAGNGLAEAQWMNDGKTLTQPISLPIEIESSLSGRILTPDGKPAAGLKISARISSNPKVQKPIAYLSTFSTVTDDNGEYTLRGLPQLELVVSINDADKRWTFQPMEDLVLNVDENRNLSFTLEAGIRVSGRVTDSDGKAVNSAHLSAITDTKVGSDLDHASTDSEGRYQLRIPSGKSRLYFNSLPSGLEYPDPQIVKQLDISAGQADIENLDFVLKRKSDQ